MILKQVFSIVLDGQSQIGKEQLLMYIEYHYHISLGNSGSYGKFFCTCDTLSECHFCHKDFFVVLVGFSSYYFELFLVVYTGIISSVITAVITSIVISIQF